MKWIERCLAVIGDLWVASKVWDGVDEIVESRRQEKMVKLTENELDTVSGGKESDYVRLL